MSWNGKLDESKERELREYLVFDSVTKQYVIAEQKIFFTLKRIVQLVGTQFIHSNN